MFFIFNKQKIYSYLIAASTVVILFILSIFFAKTNVESVETVSNTTMTNSINNTKSNTTITNSINDINMNNIDNFITNIITNTNIMNNLANITNITK